MDRRGSPPNRTPMLGTGHSVVNGTVGQPSYGYPSRGVRPRQHRAFVLTEPSRWHGPMPCWTAVPSGMGLTGRVTMPGIPANRFRFSRSRDRIESDAVSQKEWRIVQSWLDLRDFLP